MPKETTRWQDVCDKKTANFWLHPPPISLDIYSALYFILCISVHATQVFYKFRKSYLLLASGKWKKINQETSKFTTNFQARILSENLEILKHKIDFNKCLFYNSLCCSYL